MIRSANLEKILDFFINNIGLQEVKRYDNEKGKLEIGRSFGHIAYRVKNIYQTCEKLIKEGVQINRPSRDGRMAFVKSPDNISIELLQAGEPLEPKEPWKSMPNVGVW